MKMKTAEQEKVRNKVLNEKKRNYSRVICKAKETYK